MAKVPWKATVAWRETTRPVELVAICMDRHNKAALEVSATVARRGSGLDRHSFPCLGEKPSHLASTIREIADWIER